MSARCPFFLYHGVRAGLDEHGGGGPPVGLDDLRRSGIGRENLIIGVPVHHTGAHVARLAELGRIFRTMELSGDPGKGNVDLGKIILDWHGPYQPGDWIARWLSSIQEPCHGYACRCEYHVNEFPITAADEILAKQWGYDLSNPDDLLSFRCQELAVIIRLQKHQGTLAFRNFPLVVYCGYGPGMRAEYGCDWDLMVKPLRYNGLWLAKIDVAFCAYFGNPRLPADLTAWTRKFPAAIWHNIQFPPPPDVAVNPEQAYRRVWSQQVMNRSSILRPGDGLGACDADFRIHLEDPVVNAWGKADSVLLSIASGAITGDHGASTSVQPISWGELKNS